MEVESINEPVKVRADFQGGQIVPLAFKRKSKVYKIERINGSWRDGDGRDAVHCFSVECASEIYELHLRIRDMTWRLDRVIVL